MLSRRNVRIKIMQVLYAAQRQEQTGLVRQQQLYRQLVDTAYKLYLQNLLIVQRIAEATKADEARRKTKHLPSEEDKIFTAKLARGEVVTSLTSNKALRQAFEKQGTGRTIDADQISKLYREFVKTEAFHAYQENANSGREEDTQILLLLYKWLQSQELFLNLVEDHFPLWEENKSLVIGAIKKTLKALPGEEDFFISYEAPSPAVTDFGDTLLRFLVEADEQILAKIQPLIKNWSVERVAIIDLILLKMATAEFLNFPGIPTVVTLNEYVEISKLYSTDKSKEFVNGVLDKLVGELKTSGLVKKE